MLARDHKDIFGGLLRRIMPQEVKLQSNVAVAILSKLQGHDARVINGSATLLHDETNGSQP